MTAFRLKYVNEYRDRHGNLRRYVRRKGFPSIPLPSLPGSDEFMAAYQAAIEGAQPKPHAHATAGSLKALAIDYFASIEFANLKPGSQKLYRKVIDPMVAKHGHRLVRDLPADKARKIIQEVGARAPGMANVTRAAMRMMIKHAIRLGWRKDDPFADVPKYRLGTYHTWTEDELAAFEARWPLGTRQRLAYDLLLWTSQRIGDVAKMRRPDLVDGIIHVVQQKTGAEVHVPMRPELARSLKACPNPGMNLIGDENGRAMSARRLSDLMAAAIDAASLPARCVAHGLRKASMRRFAERGATGKQMQAVSGHKSLVEIERYTAAADGLRLAKGAMAKLGKNKSGKQSH